MLYSGPYGSFVCAWCCVVCSAGLPAQVEEVCALVPSLERALEEVMELAESGMRYTTDASRDGGAAAHAVQLHVSLVGTWTRERTGARRALLHLADLRTHDTLLGNILKIIYNNLGIDEGAWMKRLAGTPAHLYLSYMHWFIMTRWWSKHTSVVLYMWRVLAKWVWMRSG